MPFEEVKNHRVDVSSEVDTVYQLYMIVNSLLLFYYIHLVINCGTLVFSLGSFIILEEKSNKGFQ